MTYFWSNTIWYLLLLLTSIASIVVIFKKSGNRRFTLAFLFSVLGFSYWIEMVLLVLTKAYTYYPMLLPNDPSMDAVLGNFFSQISVSSTAVLFCVLDLKSIYMFMFAFVYYLIDVLFVALGIYEHYWFRSIYTLLGYVPFCWFIKKWHLRLTLKRQMSALNWRQTNTEKKTQHTISLFLAAFAAGSNSLMTTQKLLGLRMFHIGIYGDKIWDHVVAGYLYGTVLIISCIKLLRGKFSFSTKVIAFFVAFACQYVLYRFGMLLVPTWWFVAASALDLCGFYLWTRFLKLSFDSIDRFP